MKIVKDWKSFNESSNNNLNSITNSIIYQIKWVRDNNSKSEWEDYGANGCMSSDDMDDIISQLKELPTNEIVLILKEVIDNYKKKYSISVVSMILSGLDDLEDFDKILNSDDRFEY